MSLGPFLIAIENGLRRLRNPSRLRTAMELRDFLSAEAAHVAQSATYAYLRARSGFMAPKLFAEQPFLEALETTRWAGYAAVLADFVLMARQRLAPHVSDSVKLESALIALYREGLARYPQSGAFETRDRNAERLAGRLAESRGSAPQEPDAIAAQAGQAIYDDLPLHPDVKRLDKETVVNSVRFRALRSWESLLARLDAGAVAADLLRPGIPDESLPLESLQAVALDVETTGLDTLRDRIVSIAVVPLRGSEIAEAPSALDSLVQPGRRIPARASAIHGISDEDVAGAPRFEELAPRISERVADTVVIGHNIGFDLAMLRESAARARLPWREPVSLDLVQIAARLGAGPDALELDTLAERYRVSTAGRHTAMGDAIIAARLWAKFVPLLADRGITTLGQARGFASEARQVSARQRTAGW